MYKSELYILLCTCFLNVCFARVDYCDVDKRNSSLSTPGLQFTKEISTLEYAVGSNFKSLHCCAKGYRSIEWFKDDKAYPWPGDVSSFILYPESANQTIYSKALRPLDAGNYTCRVVDDSQAILHTSSLTVFDKSKYMDDPLPTYILPNEHFVRLGETARLYCEAFVGSSDLPDAAKEVDWVRTGVNISEEDQKRFYKKETVRESKQIIGAYLFIDKVVRMDLGTYECKISNAGDQIIHLTTILREEELEVATPEHFIPWSSFILVISACVLAALTVLMMYKRFALSIMLFFKQRLSRSEQADGKEYDVMVCYTEKDSDFVLGVLMPALHKKFNYSSTWFQITSNTVTAELQTAAALSRRLMIVMSSSLCDNQWVPGAICQMFNKLTPLHSQIICLLVQPLPQGESYKTEDGIKLKSITQKMNIIQWENKTPLERRRFWTSLRLCLPVPCSKRVAESRIVTNRPITIPTAENTMLSPLTKSNESLEILV